jgi:uncharacterized membrane protein YeiH
MDFLKTPWLGQEFHLPPAFDISGVFFFALTGALAAMRRGYDVIGLFAMALVTGLGGALIRDGIFLQNGPPPMTKDWRYITTVLAGCLAGWLVGHYIERYRKVIAILDAVGLGAYSVVGVHKSLAAGLSIPAAVLVGVINACGGGLLRDVIIREEPLMMKPGQFYVMASLLGCVVFVVLVQYTEWTASLSALIAIVVTFVFRILAIVLNWRTSAIQPWLFDPEEIQKKKVPVKPEVPGKNREGR